MSGLLQHLFESIGENQHITYENLFTKSEITLLTEAGILNLEHGT
ncbi:MAG: hypothetical protein ACC644_00395 [Candidatus Hydrothermarchaeales archaeon]